MLRTNRPFDGYAQRLCRLLQAPHDESRLDGVMAALDGEASTLLRRTISLQSRRDVGCFFTSAGLADRLVEGIDTAAWKTIADPSCGAGDLLLSIGRRLPLQRSVRSTLQAWGQLLVGRDLNDDLVRTTRVRLALLASVRHGRRATLGERELARLLPEIRKGDGQALDLEHPTLVLLNPPFGSTLTSSTGWGSGRLGRAAVFTAAVVERLPHQSRLLAILPDVLRSGSNDRNWRMHMSSLLHVETADAQGQFDAWTDIDVFILRAAVEPERSSLAEWQFDDAPCGIRLGDLVEVRVGTVVPHRDRHTGSWSSYIEAHDLPLGGRFNADSTRRRRHSGRRFQPPFVAVRRTSRPGQSQPRALGVLIEGAAPVLVENHLMVCQPINKQAPSCDEILDVLGNPVTSAWLDARIRCRHLTVRALRDVPMPKPYG